MVYPQNQLPIQVSRTLLAIALGCSILTGFFATYLMSKLANKMRPSDILGRL